MIKRILFSAILATTAIAAATAPHLRPRLVYNPSPSVPTGFYLRVDKSPGEGDFVTIAAMRAAPIYAGERGFVDRTDHFIKRVAARSGHQVCANGPAVTLDGKAIAHRFARDSAGRVLPAWSGCRVLTASQVFLLGDTPDSFDGRYWGPTSLRDIDGVWRPLRP